jgi:hypothetical protein
MSATSLSIFKEITSIARLYFHVKYVVTNIEIQADRLPVSAQICNACRQLQRRPKCSSFPLE